MGASERNCLERMCDIIAGSEDTLLGMVAESVRLHGVDRGPHTSGAWREALRGLSDAIFQAVYGHLEVADDAPRHDPVVAYGVVRGRLQGVRGVSPADWSRLMRYYRNAYVELVRSSGSFGEDELIVCRRFIDWVFDRMEDGFGRGYHDATGLPAPLEGDTA